MDIFAYIQICVFYAVSICGGLKVLDWKVLQVLVSHLVGASRAASVFNL